KPFEAWAQLARDETRRRGAEARLTETPARTHSRGPILEARRKAARGGPALAERWMIDHAEQRHPGVHERDQRAEERVARHERASAVDRVDQPLVRSVGQLVGFFLTLDAVL